MESKHNVLKEQNLKYNNKGGVKMGIGEYVGLLSFGIISTGALAYRPMDLPLFVVGAFVFALIFVKITNWAYYQINQSKVSFVIFGILAGIFAAIGILISTKVGMFVKVNGILWMFMAITLMKFNLDEILQ